MLYNNIHFLLSPYYYFLVYNYTSITSVPTFFCEIYYHILNCILSRVEFYFRFVTPSSFQSNSISFRKTNIATMKIIGIFVTTLLILPSIVFSTSCFKEYQCIFHWLSETNSPGRPSSTRSEFSFDLRPLCGANDRNYTFYTVEGYKWSIIYTICGNTSYACNPSWPHSFSRGVTIQVRFLQKSKI